MKDLKLEKFTMSNWAKVHNFNSQANSMDAHIVSSEMKFRFKDKDKDKDKEGK